MLHFIKLLKKSYLINKRQIFDYKKLKGNNFSLYRMNTKYFYRKKQTFYIFLIKISKLNS